MNDELGRKILTKLAGLHSNGYSYLKDNNDEGRKAKGTKKCGVKKPYISRL